MTSNQLLPERLWRTAGRRTFDKAFRLLVVGAVACGATLISQPSARATPFPESPKADSTRHGYCIYRAGSMTQARKNVVYWAMSRLDSTTDMTVRSESCAPVTDVWWQERNLPAGVRGRERCSRFVDGGGGKCESADVYLDFGEIDRGPDDWYDARKTAVHELGHTIGLGHHSPGSHDCAMYNNEVPSRHIKWRSYHSHDIGHINAAY